MGLTLLSVVNRRAILVLLALAGVSLALLSCTKKSSGSLEYGLKVEDTFRANILQEPPSLDWNKSTDTTSNFVTVNLMEGLTAFDLQDPEFKLKPALALSWTPSEKARIWTFKIRPGVKWTDGGEFTAQQVLDGWERLLNPATASEYAYFLFSLKNARDFNKGKIKDFSKVGAKINADGDIVVELEQSMAYFPMLLTHHSTYPIRKDLIAKHGDKWTEAGNLVTLGAYILKVWDHDKALVLERNDNYYADKAKIKNVLIYLINEYSTAINLLESGALDFQYSLPYRELPTYRQRPGFRMTPLLATYYYGFNTKTPPFNNLKVRKAFAHAVDKKQLMDLLAADQIALSSWVPVGMFGHEADIGLKFDPVLAGKLLDEAGFKDRSKLPKITLSFNSNENHQRIAENIQSQFKKNLGVEIQLANEEWKVYLNRLHNDTPPIYRLGWVADFPDPSTFMSLMTSFSENNHTKWGNAKYDELILKASGSLDREERKKLYAEAQKILVEQEVPVIPIYSTTRHILLSDRVDKFPLNPLEQHSLKDATFK